MPINSLIHISIWIYLFGSDFKHSYIYLDIRSILFFNNFLEEQHVMFCSIQYSCFSDQDESLLIWYSGKEEKHIKLCTVSKIIPGQRTVSYCDKKISSSNSIRLLSQDA